MALQYRNERKNKNEKLTDNILKNMPSFMMDFKRYVSVTKSDTTILSYTRDLEMFFTYLVDKLNKKKMYEILVGDLNNLNIMDIKEYESFLSTKKKLSNTTIKRRLSSISTLYTFLNNIGKSKVNPMTNYEYPKAQYSDIIYLNAKQTQKLLDGVLSNKMYIVEKNTGIVDKNGKIKKEKIPIEIPYDLSIKREKDVLRNYAIFMLFLGTGLRVSELVGIDIDDLDFEYDDKEETIGGSVLVSRKGKNMSIDRVYFGKDVALSILNYINGEKIDMSIVSKYDERFLPFCYKNAFSKILLDKAYAEFGYNLPNLGEDIIKVCKCIRMSGRNVYKPKYEEKALFLSMRGTRISVRSIEMIVKENVLCYLPDLKNKDRISPHKLRSTCATRLLSQTGDILLVSKQHGHSSPSTTAKFYAQLQEDKTKKKISKLDITDW